MTNNISSDSINETCPAVAYQAAAVCVPVTVVPFAHTDGTITHCCGDPVVTTGDKPCAGKKKGTCTFTISQNICVEVPVIFGADAVVGDAYVDCKGASSDDVCTGCGEE